MTPIRPSPFSPGRPRDVGGETWQVLSQIVDRINYLIQMQSTMAAKPPEVTQQEVKRLEVAIAAVQDALTEGTTFAGAGPLQPISGDVSINASGDGFTITGTAGSAVINIVTPATARTALGLGALAVLNQAVGPANVVGSAGATYDAATIALIDDLVTAVNDIIDNLQAAGIMT